MHTVESFLFVRANVHGFVKILLLHWKVISWVTGLLHYNARNCIMFHGDVNSWVGVICEIHEH